MLPSIDVALAPDRIRTVYPSCILYLFHSACDSLEVAGMLHRPQKLTMSDPCLGI